MAKLVKMMNIRNLIILIVLLATTLVSSMSRQETEEKIRIFEDLLDDYIHFNLRVNGINHFNSWPHWGNTTFEFKEACILQYENKLYDARLNERSDRRKLRRLAYKALDTEITNCVTDDLELLTNRTALKQGMESIYNRGEYIKFEAYCAKANKTTMEELIGQHMRNDPNLNLEQAQLIAVLPGYLTRVA